MKPALPKLTMLVLALSLSACTGERSGVGTTPEATAPAESEPVADVPPATAPPATVPPPATPAPAPPPDATALARYDGYGDLRFGMGADEAKKAFGGDLNGAPGAGETCYYLSPVSNPAPSHFAFMIENGKFVRYDVGNDKETAPGGGKRGMDAERIRQLYEGRIEETAHKYVPGGKVLRIKDSAGSGVLVFETDAAGKVSGWRVGVAPQVDYVEGCS